LQTTALPDWELALLRAHRLRYVVVDRRRRSFDNTAGYYFGFRPGAGIPDTVLTDVSEKFERIRARRIYDSGNIIVYDMGPMR
jgi:hypothetical protein